MILRLSGLVILWVMLPVYIFSQPVQQDDNGIQKPLPQNYIDNISSKANSLQKKLDKKAEKTLQQMKRQEARIKNRLAKKDSLKAATIFAGAEQQYNRLEKRLQKVTSANQYIPSLDTLGTSLLFLQQNPQLLSHVKSAKQKVTGAISKVKELEKEFQKAEEIKKFLKERKQFLNQQLEQSGFARELKKINKNAYYFNEQINEYKNILNDQDKIERKAIDILCKTSLFKEFFNRNSPVAGLFPSGTSSMSNAGGQAGFAGLQTRMQVTTFIQQSVAGASMRMPPVQRNIQDAQSQLNDLRSKISELTGSNGTNTELPDFKPNSQKVKSFWKRLEYGTSFQSQKSRGILPSTTDIGLSVGYKLNDKSIIGIGGSYKLGLGNGWKKIRLSSQGIGLRSFVDWKIKAGILISGGYELNYRPELRGFTVQNGGQVFKAEAWQPSGLIGLSKTISLKTKFFKKTKFQLLWDFLSYQQKPRAQAIVFRVGYNF